jgi:hypothetical protein
MFDPAYKCLPKAEHYDHHEYVLIWKMPPLQNIQAVYSFFLPVIKRIFLIYIIYFRNTLYFELSVFF